jgi:hypothetical protein
VQKKFAVSLYLLAIGLAVAFVITAATVAGFAEN